MAELKAEVKAAVIDASKNVNNQAGRDVFYNDPSILKWVIAAFMIIIVGLFMDNLAIRKWKNNLVESKKQRDDRIMELQNKLMVK
jgi:hypothetical protein